MEVLDRIKVPDRIAAIFRKKPDPYQEPRPTRLTPEAQFAKYCTDAWWQLSLDEQKKAAGLQFSIPTDCQTIYESSARLLAQGALNNARFCEKLEEGNPQVRDALEQCHWMAWQEKGRTKVFIAFSEEAKIKKEQELKKFGIIDVNPFDSKVSQN